MSVKNTAAGKQEEAFSFLKDNSLLEYPLRLIADIRKRINKRQQQLQSLAKKLSELTPKESQELQKILKEEYGQE